jgi:hypothetical protein
MVRKQVIAKIDSYAYEAIIINLKKIKIVVD